MGSKTFTSEEMYKVIFLLVHNGQRFFYCVYWQLMISK